MKVIPPTPATHATGTLTVNDYSQLADDTFQLNSNTATEGIDWTAETSNDVTAENIAAYITGFAPMDCTAVAVANVVHITAITAGAVIYGLATSDDTNLTRSGIQLQGGEDETAPQGIAFTGRGYLKSVSVSAANSSANSVQVFNGQDAGGTEYDYITGEDGKTVVRTYKGGMYLPDGGYILAEENVTDVVIEYELL